MNTTTAPLGTTRAWLTWKGPTCPVSLLPRTSCRLTLQAQVRGPRAGAGGNEGRSRRGRGHMTCLPPPPLPDHITLPLALMFEDVAVATTNFSFYDCSAVQALEAAAP